MARPPQGRTRGHPGWKYPEGRGHIYPLLLPFDDVLSPSAAGSAPAGSEAVSAKMLNTQSQVKYALNCSLMRRREWLEQKCNGGAPFTRHPSHGLAAHWQPLGGTYGTGTDFGAHLKQKDASRTTRKTRLSLRSITFLRPTNIPLHTSAPPHAQHP